MGPSPHLSPLFKKLDDFSQPPNYNYLQYAVDSRATQSWYIHPPLDNRHGNLRPSNNHTLLISEAFHMGIDGIQHDGLSTQLQVQFPRVGQLPSVEDLGGHDFKKRDNS
jgi:hypothetical protein